MIIKDLLRKAVYGLVVPIVGKVGLSHNRYCNVIYYHDIVEGQGDSFMRMNVEKFKSHIRYLVDNGYETLRFDDMLDNQLFLFKKKKVIIAFDDGWVSNYDEIFEMMRDYGVKYNVFLTIGEIDNNPQYLTWNQVREMHESGLCGFGAHTYSHPDMSDILKVDFQKEIGYADYIFEKELHYKPLDFCFPFGYYSEESINCLIEKADYFRIYTSKNLYSYYQNECYVMGRNGISNDDSLVVFKNKLDGYENVFYSLKRKLCRK